MSNLALVQLSVDERRTVARLFLASTCQLQSYTGLAWKQSVPSEKLTQ